MSGRTSRTTSSSLGYEDKGKITAKISPANLVWWLAFDREAFVAKGNAFTILPTLLYPESRGEIRSSSKDPAKRPQVDPKYFSRAADMAVMVEGVRVAQRIARSKALDRSRGRCFAPGFEGEDTATLETETRRRASTLFHPVGTCKMGRDRDPDAVVDPELRVRGIEALRVVDASIMPIIPGGNTNAPTIMIAEKAADLILRARTRA